MPKAHANQAFRSQQRYRVRHSRWQLAARVKVFGITLTLDAIDVDDPKSPAVADANPLLRIAPVPMTVNRTNAPPEKHYPPAPFDWWRESHWLARETAEHLYVLQER
ncbi:Uncharacterised protein [Vibrio cholerae]|nr:Uncharacterised protein [Vibrio cholerae]CSC37791.1 Uncharacterised protein [Vibrio cholerae]CSC46827.1 Uncharacterised protein [Vibrio cholerae]